MKKSLIVAAITVLGFTTVNAQEPAFGLKTGFNSLSLRASADGVSASESASGFYVGAFGDFQISEKFNIQPELQFISVSEDGESSSVLALPIMAEVNVAEKFSILADPQLDLLLDEDADGIKKFGDATIAALLKEFKQLHEGSVPGKPVVSPINPEALTTQEKRNALNAVTLIKQKHDGT